MRQHRRNHPSLRRILLQHPLGLEWQIRTLDNEFEPPAYVILGEHPSEVVRECKDGLDLAHEHPLMLGWYLQPADQKDIGKVSNDFRCPGRELGCNGCGGVGFDDSELFPTASC